MSDTERIKVLEEEVKLLKDILKDVSSAMHTISKGMQDQSEINEILNNKINLVSQRIN